MMGTDRNARSQPKRSRAGGVRPEELVRIPLPPLPAARGARPADRPPDRSTTPAAPAPGPAHEGPHDPLHEDLEARTGAPGAVLLNDLVDEIERDLERDVSRRAPEEYVPAYRRSVGCALTLPEPGAGPRHEVTG